MKRPSRRLDSFRDTVTAGKNQIVPLEIKSLDGPRKERQIIAIAGGSEGEPLDGRCPDPPCFDGLRYASRYVQQGKNICSGEQFTERFYAALSAAHARQPIVNQCNLCLCQHDGATRTNDPSGPPRRG